MAVTAHVYGLAQAGLMSKTIDLVNDAIKVMLCTSAYVPNQDAHQFKSDITGEVVGTGYTAGGQALTVRRCRTRPDTPRRGLRPAQASRRPRSPPGSPSFTRTPGRPPPVG